MSPKRPRGRPPCSAQWDGQKWVMDPDALEIAAMKMEENRIKCRERKRATRAALRELKPELFKHTDQTKLTDNVLQRSEASSVSTPQSDR